MAGLSCVCRGEGRRTTSELSKSFASPALLFRSRSHAQLVFKATSKREREGRSNENEVQDVAGKAVIADKQ